VRYDIYIYIYMTFGGKLLDHDVPCLSYLHITNFLRIFCFLCHIAYITRTLLTGNDGLPAAQFERHLTRHDKFPIAV
jgi:hypothetical protein